MEYEAEISEEKQIQLNEFPFLPGDPILWKKDDTSDRYYIATVIGVGAANPEYVLGGPNAKGAEAKIWKEGEHAECEMFLRGGGHLPVLLKLKKSMWAVISYREEGITKTVTLFTYEILDAIKKELLVPLG